MDNEKLTESEISQDNEFFVNLICQICDYAKENEMSPNETVDTIGQNLIRIATIASFEAWETKEKLKSTNTCRHVGDINEVDQFVCSECGIHLEDWAEKVEDEDGDLHHQEYAFKFCPNCGRKIVDE